MKLQERSCGDLTQGGPARLAPYGVEHPRHFGGVDGLRDRQSEYRDNRWIAYLADLATGVLAILALLTVRIRPLFWLCVAAFNLLGTVDLVRDYYHAIHTGLPALAGQLGAAYAIPVLYVPALMITHVAALYLADASSTHNRSDARR